MSVNHSVTAHNPAPSNPIKPVEKTLNKDTEFSNNEELNPGKFLDQFQQYGIDATAKPAIDFQKREIQENESLFSVMAANKWMEQANARPTPKMLFDVLWHEFEICILFADTNQGKSIKAVQIADSISRGLPIPGWKLEAAQQLVLYFDFELSDKQFEARYSINFGQHYNFHSNFLRAEINPESEIPEAFKTFEDYLEYSLERLIIEKGVRILIIDNLTYLRNETERAKDALPLMKQLKALKSKYGLSILALAHTPKRDLSKPITRNDLQGSKMLINFCDSAFAIGESTQDTRIKYIKQIKARNTEIIFDSENVCTCEITKTTNFLKFEFRGYATEREHLRQQSDNDREKQKEQALELKQQGVSNVEIAKTFGVSEGAVRKWFKKASETEETKS